MERANKYKLDKKTLDRIQAGHQAILDELKPSQAQLDHGLGLHYDSYVADVQGGIAANSPMGFRADRYLADMVRIRKELQAQKLSPAEQAERMKTAQWKWKTFESAFDPQWIETSRALWDITGVHMGLEDVAHPNENTLETALEHLARSNFVYDRRKDLIKVGGYDDIERGRREGKPCIVLALAGVGCFAEAADPLTRLDLFYALGVRMSQLTYIQKNALCCSWLQGDDTGLTPMGAKVVKRMNELGVMVDVAHCGHRSAMDVVAASSEPVLISHTACKSVYDDASNTEYLKRVLQQAYAQGVAKPACTGSRNAADELMRTVAAKDGLIAFYSIDCVIGPGPELFSTFFRHVEHAISVAGIDHVGIGTDRAYFPTWPPRSLDWTNWPYFTVGLVCRGIPDNDIRKIIGGNYLRYTRQILSKQPWGTLM